MTGCYTRAAMAIPPVILCCSGHDPSGGAGIQADIESILAMGGHAATLITTLTVQDSHNVASLHPVDPQLFLSQARLLIEDLPIAALKVGLLGSAAIADAVATLRDRLPNPVPVVIDPILRAGGGSDLASAALLESLRRRLLPRTTVLTPNLAEARRLTGQHGAEDCARALIDQGVRWILVTGGDEPGDKVHNLLVGPEGESYHWQWPRLPHRYHGSGCTLAAALAARLAQGDTVPAACLAAQEFTQQTLVRAQLWGRGQHFPQRIAR